jgi:hypothetical protein
MKIDKKLNLVIPLETENGVYYVHAMPLAKEAFEHHFLLISKTFARLYSEGLHIIAGPKVAALMLREVAADMDGEPSEKEGPRAKECTALMAEIHRLTSICLPTEDHGWQPMPLESAVTRGLIDEDDLAEIEGQLVFFICASAMHKRDQVKVTLYGMTQLWGSQTLSLSTTEFLSSLPTSTEAENSGVTVTTSLLPS